VNCKNGPIKGDGVKIIATRDDFINIAEVQVWSKKE